MKIKNIFKIGIAMAICFNLSSCSGFIMGTMFVGIGASLVSATPMHYILGKAKKNQASATYSDSIKNLYKVTLDVLKADKNIVVKNKSLDDDYVKITAKIDHKDEIVVHIYQIEDKENYCQIVIAHERGKLESYKLLQKINNLSTKRRIDKEKPKNPKKEDKKQSFLEKFF